MFTKSFRIKWLFCLLFLAFGMLGVLQAQTLGDVNGDDSVTVVDALMTAQYYVGLAPAGFNASVADVSCDSSITVVDALMMAQYYVGLIDAFACETETPTPTATPVEETPTPEEATPTPEEATPTPDSTGIPSVDCSEYPIWNSNVVYSEAGTLVQYNCNVYRNSFFTYGLNPEESYVDNYSTWVLQASCSNSDCPLGEGPWTACGDWDNWEYGDYIIYNNIWGGDAAGTQCIWADSYSSWGVTADHPATSGVKSYPNASKDIDVNISAINSLVADFDVTVPSSGSYATTFDIWTNGHAYEIMIWVNYTGEVGPIAGAWNDDGVPIAEDEGASISGYTWDVYKGNIGFTVISFLISADIYSGTIDVKDFLTYIQSQGWFGDELMAEAQFGFEITSSVGGLDFTVNSYTMD